LVNGITIRERDIDYIPISIETLIEARKDGVPYSMARAINMHPFFI